MSSDRLEKLTLLRLAIHDLVAEARLLNRVDKFCTHLGTICVRPVTETVDMKLLRLFLTRDQRNCCRSFKIVNIKFKWGRWVAGCNILFMSISNWVLEWLRSCFAILLYYASRKITSVIVLFPIFGVLFSVVFLGINKILAASLAFPITIFSGCFAASYLKQTNSMKLTEGMYTLSYGLRYYCWYLRITVVRETKRT